MLGENLDDIARQCTEHGEQILLHPFNSLFSRTTRVSWYQKGKPFWILMKQEGGIGISWTVCKSFAHPGPKNEFYVQLDECG